MQNTFVCAFSKLNKQRIRLSNMAAEGEHAGTTHNTHEAQEAVDALQKVYYLQPKQSEGCADTRRRGCAFSLS